MPGLLTVWFTFPEHEEVVEEEAGGEAEAGEPSAAGEAPPGARGEGAAGACGGKGHSTIPAAAGRTLDPALQPGQLPVQAGLRLVSTRYTCFLRPGGPDPGRCAQADPGPGALQGPLG